jgi:hypothetical protein
LPLFTELGELQSFYGTFLKNLSDLNSYLSNDLYGTKIASLTKEINGIQEFISRLAVKEKLYAENQRLEAKKFARDSSLFEDKVIAEIDFERSHQALLRVNIELQQA